MLRANFVLELFDNPFVNVEATPKIVGEPRGRKVGEAAQRKAFAALKDLSNILPV